LHDFPPSPLLRDLTLGLLAAAASTALAWCAQRWLGLTDLSTVFIVAVVLVASRTRTLAAVVAAIACFLSYDFFFLAPRFTFYIHARQGVATVVLFLAAALVAGRLASRLRAQVLALRATNAHTTALQSLGRALASAADIDAVLAAGREALAQATGAEVLLRIGDRASEGDWGSLDAVDRAAADVATCESRSTGRFAEGASRAAWAFRPLGSGGVAGLRHAPSAQAPGAEQSRLVEAMLDAIAQAALRTRLVAELEQSHVANETERLRSALLSSVSHDLRSPLAAIIGAASSLDHYGASMDAADRHSLLETVRIEGERLDRYIQNLLDMTRLGHGALTLRRDWIGVDELIGSAVLRLRRYQPEARFTIAVAPGIAPVWVHPALLEQALFNVLENAAAFSPAGEPVSVDADERDGRLRIDIGDRGPGIPEAERRRIFDMFYSVERGDRGRNGIGLGLAICQGLVGAHGGSVEALPGAGGSGTVIRIELPRVASPESSAGDGP